MKKALWMTASLAALALVAALAAAPATAAEVDGKQVFEAQKCNLCHAVSSAGIEAKTQSEKMKGPDLVGLGDNYEAEWLAKYLVKQEKLEGEDHKKEFKGSDEELQALVDWLLEQKQAG